MLPGASGRSSPGFSARPSGAVVQPPSAGGECPSAGRPQSQMCRKPCKGRTACCLHGSHRHNLVETVVTPGLKPSEDFSPSDSGEAPARRGLQGRPLPSGPTPHTRLPLRVEPTLAPRGDLHCLHLALAHGAPKGSHTTRSPSLQWPQCGFGHVHVDLLWATSVGRCPVILRRQRYIWRGLEAPSPGSVRAGTTPGRLPSGRHSGIPCGLGRAAVRDRLSACV